jgi:hypothetical protein
VGFGTTPPKLFVTLATLFEKKAQTNHIGPADMWKVRPTHLVPGPVSIALLAKTLSAMIIAGNAFYVGQGSPRREQGYNSNNGINENESYILLYINSNNSSTCLDTGL